MKKQIYFYGLAMLGVMMFTGCEQSADTNPNEKDTLLAAKTGSAHAYDDFRIVGNPDDGWYNSDMEDCSANDTEGCISMTIVDPPGDNTHLPQAVFVSDLRIKKAKEVFLSDQTIAYQLFDDIIVDGVLDDYFDLEWEYNTTTKIDYFKIKRIKDGVVVGVKPIQVKN